MTKALFVSPHLDDAVFSCGGLIAQFVKAGIQCIVITVFTGNVAQPKGFALKCQTDKGIDPAVDYMALRRDEDVAACRILNVEIIHLPYLEAPHRGYESPAALFGIKLDDDNVETALAKSLEEIILQHKYDIVLAPYGLGEHIDHRVVRAVIEQLARTVLWQDEPYAQKQGLSLPDSVFISMNDEQYLLKCKAMAAYASQLNFQFGGVEQISNIMPRCEWFIDTDKQLARLLENSFKSLQIKDYK